jgi:hypothetical protein
MEAGMTRSEYCLAKATAIIGDIEERAYQAHMIEGRSLACGASRYAAARAAQAPCLPRMSARRRHAARAMTRAAEALGFGFDPDGGVLMCASTYAVLRAAEVGKYGRPAAEITWARCRDRQVEYPADREAALAEAREAYRRGAARRAQVDAAIARARLRAALPWAQRVHEEEEERAEWRRQLEAEGGAA